MKGLRLAATCVGIIAILASAVPGSALARQDVKAAKQSTAPSFAFPTDGTSYPSTGPYLFQVQPVNGAAGYLWSFVQNGMIVYQNLAWDGRLSPASYTVSTSSKAHKLIRPGDLHVWVRALMKDGTWSATGAVMVRIQGKGGPKPQPTAHPTPKPAPQIHAGDVLYTANLNTLSGDPSWKHVSGMLVNDGGGGSLVLPFKSPVADYAVEVTFQFVGGKNCVLLRTREEAPLVTGYYGGICDGQAELISHNSYPVVDDPHAYGNYLTGVPYTADATSHTYRLEVRGNDLRLLIDNTPVVAKVDNTWLTGRTSGLYDDGTQINVSSIRIIAL